MVGRLSLGRLSLGTGSLFEEVGRGAKAGRQMHNSVRCLLAAEWQVDRKTYPHAGVTHCQKAAKQADLNLLGRVGAVQVEHKLQEEIVHAVQEHEVSFFPA